MFQHVTVILAMSERSCRIGRDAIIGTALTIAVVASSFTASSATTVRVAPGETLLGIADEYGTTVAALQAANNLTDPNTIVVGSVLQVHAAAGVIADAPTKTVAVEPGQTISSIAAQYHMTASALAAANHLPDPNHVLVGSLLQIPGSGAASNEGASVDRAVIVARGDTLLGIADQYGTTVDAIEAANHLSDPNRIVIGSILQVPRASNTMPAAPTAGAAGGTIVVQPGQTLWSIATSFDTTVPALASANNLTDPNTVVIGSVLRIPGTGSPAETAINAPGASGGSVIVAAGDTLMRIAHQYGTTVDTLARVNNLADPNQVAVGSVLEIPGAGASAPATVASGTSGDTVTISPGQTLSSIAAEHGTTVAKLEAVNGIVHPDLIVSGMQLRLHPASTSALASDIVPVGSALPTLLLAHPGRVALRSLFDHWAVVEGVSPALLEAMCWWESGWQTYISSVTGALGVCQLEPPTVTDLQAQLGQPALDPNVASDNIEMAAVLLHQLLVATADDVSMALAGYYQGLASVRSAGLFPSTKQYVKGILAFVPSFR